jgi:hypothetical protein
MALCSSIDIEHTHGNAFRLERHSFIMTNYCRRRREGTQGQHYEFEANLQKLFPNDCRFSSGCSQFQVGKLKFSVQVILAVPWTVMRSPMHLMKRPISARDEISRAGISRSSLSMELSTCVNRELTQFYFSFSQSTIVDRSVMARLTNLSSRLWASSVPLCIKFSSERIDLAWGCICWFSDSPLNPFCSISIRHEAAGSDISITIGETFSRHETGSLRVVGCLSCPETEPAHRTSLGFSVQKDPRTIVTRVRFARGRPQCLQSASHERRTLRRDRSGAGHTPALSVRDAPSVSRCIFGYWTCVTSKPVGD